MDSNYTRPIGSCSIGGSGEPPEKLDASDVSFSDCVMTFTTENGIYTVPIDVVTTSIDTDEGCVTITHGGVQHLLTLATLPLAELIACLGSGGPVTTPVTKEYKFAEMWVDVGDDITNPLCDLPVFFCTVGGEPDGKCYSFSGSPKSMEELPVGVKTTPYKPMSGKVCAEGQIGPFELTEGATDVATIVADALAATPVNFDFNGKVVAATADDVDEIRITPKACETEMSDGTEVTADFVKINNINASAHYDDADGGVDGSTAVEVPAGGCSVVTLCFKQCLSKTAIAALP